MCVCGSSAQCLTGVQPALEGEAAFLDVEREVVDVERARRDHLDGLVVAHQSVVRHVDVRYVWRLPHVHAAGQRRQWLGTEVFLGLKGGCELRRHLQKVLQLIDEDVGNPHVRRRY